MSIIKLSKDRYLSTEDGTMLTRNQAQAMVDKAVKRTGNIEVLPVVNKIHGRDEVTIPLYLAAKDGGNVESQEGFLVTVYLSGSPNTLTRMYQEDVTDSLSTNVVRGGFQNYIELEVDV